MRPSQILNSPAALLVARFTTLALSFASAPLIARAIGPEGRGVASAAVAIAAVTPVLVGLGVPLATRFLSATMEPEDLATPSRQLSWCTLPLSVAIGGLSNFTLIASASRPEKLAFLATMAASSAYVHALCDQSILIQQARYGIVALLQSAQAFALTAVVLVAFAMDRLTATVVIAAFGVGSLATFTVGVVAVRASPSDPGGLRRTLLTRGVGYFPSQVVDAANSRLDQALMLAVMGSTQAGFYSVSVTIAALPLTIGHALGTASFHAVSHAAERTRALSTGRTTLRGAFLLGSCAAAALALIVPFGVPVLFGEPFRPAITTTLIALVGAPFVVTNFVGNQVLAALGNGRMMLISSAAGLACAMPLYVLLAPGGGAPVGAAVIAIGQITTTALIGASLGFKLRTSLPTMTDARYALRQLSSADISP